MLDCKPFPVFFFFTLLAACSTTPPPAIPPTAAPGVAATATLAASPSPAPSATLAPPSPAASATPTRRTLSTPGWFDDVVLYEIFPRSFYDSNGDGIGDLKGVTSKLDYLSSLGVGAIWLTPIFASPSYHGYDTTDYYRINPDFGTGADLVELVQAAHAHHIRVLLDYVVAHASNQHPFFRDAHGKPNSKHADWYRWTDKEHLHYESFAGVQEMPTLNHDNPEVQRYLIDVARYWMKTGIDGYRADYVLNVPHPFWKKLRAELKAIRPDFLLLAEAWTQAPAIKTYYDDEFDAAFDFPLYGDIEGSQDKIGDSFLLGVLSPHLMDGTLAAERALFPAGAQRVEFLNNHDTNRVMSEVKGDVRRAKLAATLLLTLPGTPMLYYGEEVGMSGVKGSGSGADPPRREPMDWYAAEVGPGMTRWYKPVDRNNKPNDGVSVEEEEGRAGSLLEHYRKLIALRNSNSALRTGALELVDVESAGPSVYGYLRRDSTGALLMLFNLSDTPADATIDLSGTSLPNRPYRGVDLLSNQTLELDDTSLRLYLGAVGSSVLQLTPRRCGSSG